MKTVFLLATAGMLCACSTVEQLADRHTDANQVQAEATNQQLLLNVVRASLREPMHFSRIPEVALPLASTSLAGLTIPFGNGTNKEYTLSGQATASAQTVRVVPQDSQEFTQGLLQPVSAGLLAYHLDQGWPRRLVLTLMVERVIVKTSDGELVLDGHTLAAGEDAADARAQAFYRWLDAVARLAPAIEPGEDEVKAAGPAMAAASAASQLAGLAALRASGAQLKETTSGWQPVATRSTSRLRVRDPACLARLSAALAADQRLVKVKGALARPRLGSAAPDSVVLSMDHTAGTSAAGAFALILRSPSAMIYHMGELLRSGDQARSAVMAFQAHRCDGEDGRPSASQQAQLWPVQATVEAIDGGVCSSAGSQPGLRSGTPFVSVAHRGCRYTIWPGHESDRTTQALALVKQVLELQYKGAAAPSAVRLQSP